MIRIRREPKRGWAVIRMTCGCGCGAVVRSSLGASVAAAVSNFRFNRQVEAVVASAFEEVPRA